ncbi:MAG: dihydropteroate synthase [Desulfobacterales bacterium]|jgi:dihydropteroate synthase|nr:dihydropteroate synthase [Desulfobacterales bacterium]
MPARKAYRIAWGRHVLDLGRRTCIMGILNVTPDSFSDGGRFVDPAAAVAQGVQMARDGAHIIDVGGESTRPFSEPVTADEEIRRVVPVISALAERIELPISIDTTKSRVARRALEAGASLLNDISGLKFDPAIAKVASEFAVPLILMHMQGDPRTMQVAPRYHDLIGDIRAELQAAAAAAERAGVARDMLIADPGIGFGKTPGHNLQLLQRIADLASLELPLLVGPSRKSFIRRLVRRTGEEDPSADRPVVETGTQAAVAAAVMNGAHIVRVHDVARTWATLQIVDAIRNA